MIPDRDSALPSAGDPYASPETRYSYTSGLVERMRTSDFSLRQGRITVRTAKKFGFCWGVDRAVAMIHDLLDHHPGRRVWLLNQLIHNPRVNADLEARGVRFLVGPRANPRSFDEVTPRDVVVIPAFHAEVELLERLDRIGCEILDTTCPWVSKPHRRTLKNIADGFTTIIHGLFDHDETRATRSLIASRGARYVVVQDLRETELLARGIETRSWDEETRALLAHRASPGFDPARHLERIGLINQTTMLASESRQFARRLAQAVRVRGGGDEAIAETLRDFDTICPATQNNQDAVLELLEQARPDLMIVVGGYDSSNTKNLVRTALARTPAFHVQNAEALEVGRVRHRDPETGRIRETEDWLPSGEVVVGVTAGASTPDSELEKVIGRILEAAGEAPRGPAGMPGRPLGSRG